MMDQWPFVLAAFGFAFFLYRRLPRYLHLFQQDEYDSTRFLPWIVAKLAIDKRLSLALLAVFAVTVLADASLPVWTAQLAAAVGFVGFALREPDPKKEGKKPLVLTKRATLIFRVALVLGIVIGVLIAWFVRPWGWIIAIQIAPVMLSLANLVLKPVEARSQQFFLNDAKRRLAQIDPTVIGVTGSYGKTTIKHIIGHVLSLTDNAFFTPGSVNTTMGISRVIREQLPDDTHYFVAEMGAYGPGSIARLCALTPPKVGLITAIGEAHYERFKTLDTVAHAKFELAEAVLANGDGKITIHESVLEQPHARKMVEANRARFIVCGEGEVCDVRVTSWAQTVDGLQLAVVMDGKTYDISAPVYGAHNVGNLAMAFGLATGLGVDPGLVVTALRTTPQTKHRLEVKRQGNGLIVLDDAYNSNPTGFTAALEILSLLAEGKRKRVLVTPGMVELGAKHDEFHTQLGTLAAQHADIAIVVRPERIPTFVEAFKAANKSGQLVTMGSFVEARAWMDANVGADAVILLENDLPDLYERKLAL